MRSNQNNPDHERYGRTERRWDRTYTVNPATFEVWGSGGITVTQDDIYFTGDSVYVYGVKDRAKIDGGVNLSRNGLTISADSVDFNWRTRIAVFNGNVQVSQDGGNWSANSVSYNVDSNSFL